MAAVTARSRTRRALRLALVVALGLALGGVAFVALQVASTPPPRPAPGWSLSAVMPNGRGETAGAVAGDRLFVVGGLAGLAAQASADVSIHSPATDTWTAGPALPEARHHAGAVGLDGAVYISGGASSVTDWTPRDGLWVLDPGAAAWRPLAAMHDARTGHRMVALAGRLYVVFWRASRRRRSRHRGRLSRDPCLRPCGRRLDDRREPAGEPRPPRGCRGRWRDLGDRRSRKRLEPFACRHLYRKRMRGGAGTPLPEPVSGASEGTVGGVIYLSGGEDPFAGVIVDRHWQLDTTVAGEPEWLPLEPPPFTVHGAPGLVLDGSFYLVGGALRAAGQSSTAWTGATQLLQR